MPPVRKALRRQLPLPRSPAAVRNERGLTPRQQALVDFYFLQDFNMAAAARSAGYKQPNAANIVFKAKHIQAEIARRMKALRRDADLNASWVVERWMRLADANTGVIIEKLIANDYDLSCLTEDEKYALEEIAQEVYMERGAKGEAAQAIKKIKVKVRNPTTALESLARHLQMFNDKVTVQGELSVVERLQAGRQRVRKLASPTSAPQTVADSEEEEDG